MAHAYVTFRIRLAKHALRRFAASLRGSAEIILLVFTHAMVGLLALAALPPMYASSLPLAQALGIQAAYALLMTAPLALLRKRVLPQDVVHWVHRLPVPRRVQLKADALVAGLLAGPLGLMYLVSGTLLMYQQPAWLAPAPAILGTLLSLALTWLFSIGVLSLRSRMVSTSHWWHAAQRAPSHYVHAALRPRTLALWRRLFWLPYWRADNIVGWQQSVLLAAAVASALPWMQAPPGVIRALLALATCTLMVLVTDRGDKAVREQAARLAPLIAAWPLAPRALMVLARGFSVLPALLVVLVVFAGGFHHGLWQHPAGRAWLVLAVAGQLLLVGLPYVNERTRVGLVIAQILVLTAVGSELWP